MQTENRMTAKLVSAIIVGAYVMSAGYQVYRALLAVMPEVDRFGVDHALLYGLLIAVGMGVRSDRRWLWWVATLLMGAQLLVASFVYYQSIYAARPMGTGDWVEGTVFVAMVGAAFCLGVCHLSGLTLSRRVEVPQALA